MIFNFLNTYAGLNVTIGLVVLGMLCGAISTFAVLRRQSLIGDVVAHAALPGIVLSFILFQEKSTFMMLIGACFTGWVGIFCVSQITKHTRLKMDSVFAIILSVFFGLGVLLMSHVQKQSNFSQAGLERFLFGQASAIVIDDIYQLIAVSVLVFIGIFLFWKEFKLYTFDPNFLGTLGFSPKWIDHLMTTILVVVIVFGLQFVGVVLVAAMIVAPGAAARQWTQNFNLTICLSIFFGGVSGFIGATVSAFHPKIPTGPIVVIVLSIIVAISLGLSPQRGLIWKLFWKWFHQRSLIMDLVLLDMYALSKHHNNDPFHQHSKEVLEIMSKHKIGIHKTLQGMQAIGWITSKDGKFWGLTPEGIQKASFILGEQTQ